MPLLDSKQLSSSVLRGLGAVASVPANKMLYTASEDTFATADLGATGKSLLACASVAAVAAVLGLGSLAAQAANSVAITGGVIGGTTTVAMASASTGTSGTINFCDNTFAVRPATNSTATYSGWLVKMTYDGTADLTGGAHTIAVWGYTDINAPGRTCALALALEGKTLVRAGNLLLGSSVHAGLEDVYAGASLSTWVGHNSQVSDNHGATTTVVGHDFTVAGATVPITNGFAFRAQDVLLARVTNYAALYGLVSAKAGAHYNLFIAGTAKNVVAGSTRLGGTTDPTEVLDVTGNALVSGSISFGTDITSSGSARRFIANFSDATQSNRFSFQTSAANSSSIVSVIPSGSGNQAIFRAANTSSYTSGAVASFGITSASAFLDSGISPGGTALPMDFAILGSSKMRLFTSSRFAIGSTTDDGVNLLQVNGSMTLASGSVYKVNNTQVVGARKTGWTLPTGTSLRTGFDTATATLAQVAQTIKAMLEDFHSTAGHGLLGT